MNNCGIYRVDCINNNHFYIGQSLTCSLRFSQHIKDLRKNKHFNPRLQNCFNKYGEQSLVFKIIQNCTQNELNVSEQLWLDKCFNDPLNMNCNPISAKPPCNIGRQHSEETKNKMSASQTGKKMSEEAKNKMSIFQTGKKITQEQKNKLKIINTGKKHTLESRQKISDAQQGKIKKRGYQLSEETKNKMSISATGRKLSEEAKRKVSIAKMGNTNGLNLSEKEILSPDNQLIKFNNTYEFCKINNLQINSIYMLLNGRLKTYKKWKLPDYLTSSHEELII